MTQHRYNLRCTGYSSAKYGPCEVCGQHAAEVCYQTEEKAFPLDERDPAILWEAHPDGIGWAHKGSLFGHEACLVSKQK